MRNFYTIIIFFLISFLSFGQNSSSGSGYVLSHTIDCPAINNAEVIRFGNGTTGRVELCITANNLKSTCGGGNNKNDQVYLYEDKNNDGVLELFAIWIPTTAVNTCIITEATNGYVWARFCGDGGCSASDMSGSTLTLSWSTYNELSNNLISNAVNVNVCGTSFTSNNISATATENCDGYIGNTGPPTNLNVAFDNNLDCNTTTNNGINPGSGENGGDVGYSVENDLWYRFCPGITGTWVVTLNKVKCYTPTDPYPTIVYGYQYAIFQGTANNLGPLVSGGTSGQNNTGISTINIVVTSTANCYYLQIDGYGGTGCVFDFLLTAPSGVCTIMPVEIISFKGNKKNNNIKLNWTTITETNNDRFEILRSYGGVIFEKVGEVRGARNSSAILNYEFIDYLNYDDIIYYKLNQIDYDGNRSSSDIIFVNPLQEKTNKTISKITNILGQEVNSDYDGPSFIFYNDGSVERK